MKIGLELPIAFRGKPKGCRTVRDIFVAKTVEANVPEASLAETEVVFEVAARKKNVSGEPFELRRFNGHLYRKISGSVQEAEAAGLFTTPFEETNTGRRKKETSVHAWQCEYGADISPVQRFADNRPLARPLMDEMEWIMDRDRPLCDGGRYAWPTPETGRAYDAPIHVHRNGHHYEDVIKGTQDIDWETLARSEQMIAEQTQRLLLLSGEVWMKSRPPAIEVDPDYHFRRHDNLHIRLVVAPEVYVSKLECAHFSLADIDSAYEYSELQIAHAAREFAKDQRASESALVNSLVPYVCHDPDLLDYDWRSEAINRFGYAASVECRNHLIRNPERATKLSDAEIDAISNAFDETMQVNHVLGQHRDMADFVPLLKSAWKTLQYKQSLAIASTTGGQVAPTASIIERYLDDAPISVSLNQVAFRV